MKAVIKDVYIRAISAWLPERVLEMSSLAADYGNHPK
jgi:hypothetical protein